MTNLSRNVVSIVLGEVGSRFLAFVAAARLARIAEPENFGLVSIAVGVFGYAALLTGWGLPSYASRTVTEGKGIERETAGDIIGLRVFLALCGVFFAACASLAFIDMKVLQFLILLYALSVIPLALNLEWFFQGKETMRPIGISRVAANLVYAALIFVLVGSPGDILKAPVAFLLGNSTAAVLLAATYRIRTGSFDLRWKPMSLFRREGEWHRIMRRSIPIGLGNALTQASYNLPPVLLGILSTAIAAAFFSAASRLVFFLMAFDRIVTTVLLPAVARYQKSAPDQLGTMLTFVQRMVLVFVLPVCVGGMMLATDLVQFVYGPEFSDAVPVLRVLIWYFLFSAAGSVYTFGLLGIGEEKVYGRCVMKGTIAQIGAMVVGTIVWGDVGAAAGYAVGEAILFLLMYSGFEKFVRTDLSAILLKPLISAVVMGAILFPMLSYGLAMTIPFGALVFFGALVAMRGFTREDLRTLRQKLL